MNEEEFKKIAEKTMQEQIMKNLDSTLIFTYIRNLEQQNEQLEFDYRQMKEIKNIFFDRYNKLVDKITNQIKEYEQLDKKEFAKQGNFDCEISVLKDLLKE